MTAYRQRVFWTGRAIRTLTNADLMVSFEDHPSHALNTHPSLRRNHLEPLGNRKEHLKRWGGGHTVSGLKPLHFTLVAITMNKQNLWDFYCIKETSWGILPINSILPWFAGWIIWAKLPFLKNHPILQIVCISVVSDVGNQPFLPTKLTRTSSTTHGVPLAGARSPRSVVQSEPVLGI